MSREEEIRSILKQMLRKLEDKIRRRENEIYGLEELLKAKDEKLRKAEEKAKKPCLLGRKELENSQQIQRRCLYNDRGHYKYGRACLFLHVSEVCRLGQECPHQHCQRRHPYRCRYGENCQFGPSCSFYHSVEHLEEYNPDDEEKKDDGKGIDTKEKNDENPPVEEVELV